MAEDLSIPGYFREAAVLPVRAFFDSLVSVSLSSPVTFLLLLLPAAERFAEVVLVGVAWLDALSAFMKLVEIGVGAVCAGVDCAEAIGDSCFSIVFRLGLGKRDYMITAYRILFESNTAIAEDSILIYRASPAHCPSSCRPLRIVLVAHHNVSSRSVI